MAITLISGGNKDTGFNLHSQHSEKKKRKREKNLHCRKPDYLLYPRLMFAIYFGKCVLQSSYPSSSLLVSVFIKKGEKNHCLSLHVILPQFTVG